MANIFNKFLGGVIVAATWCGLMFVIGLTAKLTVILFMLGYDSVNL